MEIAVRGGKILKKPTGLPEEADGLGALLQRTYNRILIRRGSFCYDRTLGSALSETDLHEEHAAERALGYVRAALLHCPELEAADLKTENGSFAVTIRTPLGAGEITAEGGRK